jgi:hypothetical protein
MSVITAGMLTENPKPPIVPGDIIRVSREFEVTEVGYNELTDTTYYGTYGGYKYGTKNWDIQKISDSEYLHTLLFGGKNKEAQMGSYNSTAKTAGEVVGNERLVPVTRYSDLKSGDVIRVTRDAVVSEVRFHCA